MSFDSIKGLYREAEPNIVSLSFSASLVDFLHAFVSSALPNSQQISSEEKIKGNKCGTFSNFQHCQFKIATRARSVHVIRAFSLLSQ